MSKITCNKVNSVELKIELSKIYIEEFKRIKTKKDALEWSKSVPNELKTVILSLLAIDKLEDRISFV